MYKVASSKLHALELIYNMIKNDHKDGTGGNVFIGKAHDSGYCVGLQGRVFFDQEDLDHAGIDGFIAMMSSLDMPNLDIDGIGYWVDGSDIYVDQIIVVNDLESAKKIGAVFDQLSVFDLESGEVVWL